MWLQRKQVLILKTTASQQEASSLQRGNSSHQKTFFFVGLCGCLENVGRIYCSHGTKLVGCWPCCAEACGSASVGVWPSASEWCCFVVQKKNEFTLTSSPFHNSYISLTWTTEFCGKTNHKPFAPFACFCSYKYGFSIAFSNMESHSLPHKGL